MTDELHQARETIARLNRRVQVTEASLADLMAVNEKLASGALWVSGSTGRAFLAWDNQRLRDEMARLVNRHGRTDLVAVAERIIARTDGYNRMEDADPNGYVRLVELAAAFVEYHGPTQSTR